MKPGVSFIIFCLTGLFLALSGSSVKAQQRAVKETYLYSIKGTDSLFLDRYYPGSDTAALANGKHPCLIFVFGGGFFTGNRDNSLYTSYYNWLVEKGFNVIAIDYRLGLKPLLEMQKAGGDKKQKMGPVTLINLMFHSINIAVEDFFDATNFVLSHAKAWNIDTSLVISSGSSAGAITVLQGEYYRTNSRTNYKQNKKTANYALAKKLPNNFDYAGVIAFAGAIANKRGKIEWKGVPPPIQMFHGNADSNVPYDKMATILGGLYGSKFIADELTRMNAPHYLFTVDNAPHSIAVSPMNIYRDQISEFIHNMVIADEPLMIDETVKIANEPPKRKKFGIKAYIKANFIHHKPTANMLSYNVHNCIATDASRTRDYKAIADIIKQSGAGVIALQELDSMTTRTPLYVLGELEKETGMHGTYAPAIDFGGGKYGIGILSKDKPLAVKRIPLPGSEEQRALLIAEFDQFIFCCTHLSLTPADQLASVAMIRHAVKEFVKGDKNRRHKPVFIGGDFNAVPGSSTMQEFSKYATPVSNISIKTFPANDPGRCIDYILLLDKKVPKQMDVFSCGRLVTPLTRTASDHLPVYSITQW